MNLAKISTLIVIASVLACAGFAAARLPKPTPMTDLKTALERAKNGKKLLFIQNGRPKCGNCQAVRDYIMDGQIQLSANKFVYVILNCDDKATNQEFNKRYKVNGHKLPLVVIADPDGNQLAEHSGWALPAVFNKLIHEAESKTGK